MKNIPNDDMNFDEENQERRKDFIEIAQEEQIAEGDISVSETIDGEDPTPDIDDREIEDEVWGEDDLAIKDEDNPRLGLEDDGLEKRSYLK